MSARQTSKRPPPDSVDSQRPKRGRPTNENKNSQIPDDAVSRQTVRTMLQDRPCPKVDKMDERQFYRGLIETPIENWSTEDEAAVVSDWNQSEAKSRCKKFTSQHSDLLKTWKISLRLYQETPVTILSLFTSLRYQPVSAANNAIEVIYSATFCRELSKLMVHPCFEQKTTLLTLALRWTVICRLDDRRFWELNRTYGCPALKVLSKAIEERKSSRMKLSYHEMHEAARKSAFEQRTETSVLSNLLYNIGQAVSDEGDSRPPVDSEYQTDKGFDVLPVTLWDLRVLAKAVDSTQFRAEWNYTTEEAFMAWNAEPTSSDPPEKAMLPLLYELAHLDLLRHHVVLRRKGSQRAESQASHPDVVAAEHQTLSAQRAVCDGDSDNTSHEFSPIHRTSSLGEQGYDDMTSFVDGGGGVDSDGSIAPLKPDLSPPHEPTRPETTPASEGRPFRRERRYKALIDGEETEDEQEDLQRNQRDQLDSRQRPVPDRQDTIARHRFGDRTSQFDLGNADREPNAATKSSLRFSPHPVPFASHGFGAAFGQLAIPGESSNDMEEIKLSLNRIENLYIQILDKQSKIQEAHRPVANPIDQRPDRAGNASTPEAAPIAVSAEMTESDLVRDLRAQVAQLQEKDSQTMEKNSQLLKEKKELSDKVKYQKFDISDLHQDLAQEKAGREAERKRADEAEAKLREEARLRQNWW